MLLGCRYLVLLVAPRDFSSSSSFLVAVCNFLHPCGFRHCTKVPWFLLNIVCCVCSVPAIYVAILKFIEAWERWGSGCICSTSGGGLSGTVSRCDFFAAQASGVVVGMVGVNEQCFKIQT